VFHLLYKKNKFLIMNINIDDPELCASYMLVYIKAKDVVIYLPIGMNRNVFYMTRGSFVGQMLPHICHLSIINEKKVMPLNVHY
jgi:hypothetical protein